VKEIKLNDETIEIKKMGIGKFAQLMLAVEDLPNKLVDIISLEELEYIDEKLLLTKAPSIIANAQDEVFNLIAVASGIDKKRFELDENGDGDIDFEGFLDIITAIIELNNIQAIVSKVKNLRRVFQAKVQ
jgi:hypothetical protein